jgi:hypothetical protein
MLRWRRRIKKTASANTHKMRAQLDARTLEKLLKRLAARVLMQLR